MSAAQPVLYNFSAGPAILAPEVFHSAATAVQELRHPGHSLEGEGCGFSILELSHRGPEFTAIHEEATELCHQVLGIPKSHAVMFLQGGASMQFAMVPANFYHRASVPPAYVDTGAWSSKAIREARVYGEVEIVASSKDTAYDRIPELPCAANLEALPYLHVTTNNTIVGTEFSELPTKGQVGQTPLVIDASSNIGSRPMDFSRVALGYAGAQKNLGPSGLTLVFADKEFLKYEAPASTPHFLRYATHAPSGGLYNTPNTFGVLVLLLSLRWLQRQGGVEGIEARNRDKAESLYAALDASSLYRAHAQVGSRSRMNVSWTLAGAPEADRDALTKRFLTEAANAGLRGLKGHRSVGGCRASIYNAFPMDGVAALVDFLREFEARV